MHSVLQASEPRVKPHLKALTGLRFFPALHVILYHVVLQALGGAPEWLRNIVGSGFVGVGLFFVLSGFILAYSYLDAQGEKQVDKRAFWQARFARIYPVYVLGTLAMVPFYLIYLHSQMSLPKAILKAFAGALICGSLLQSWIPSYAALLNFPSWSLSDEAFFYLLFPFVVPLLQRVANGRLVAWMVGLWVVSLLAPLCHIRVFGPESAHLFNFWGGVVKFNPLVRLPEFLVGVVLGIFFLRRIARQSADDSPRLDGVYSAASLGAALFALLVLSRSPHIPYILLSNCVLVPAFVVLIYSLAFGRGVLSRFLSLPLVMLLGEASYALYILHIPLYTLLGALAKKMNVSTSSGTFLAFYLVCAIGASLLVLRYIEQPAREAIKKRLRQR